MSKSTRIAEVATITQTPEVIEVVQTPEVATITQTPDLAQLLGTAVAAQPSSAHAQYPTSLGLSAAALLRYLGAQGVRAALAEAILAKVCPSLPASATIKTQLYAGRKGNGSHGKTPVLNQDQSTKLAEAITSLLAK